jgi:hypothetical protein
MPKKTIGKPLPATSIKTIYKRLSQSPQGTGGQATRLERDKIKSQKQSR